MAVLGILKGSWDLVTRVIIRVTILITPIKVLITLLTKSHDPPSRTLGLRFRFRAVRGFGGPCWGFRFKDGLEDQGLESTPKSANAILTGAR